MIVVDVVVVSCFSESGDPDLTSLGSTMDLDRLKYGVLSTSSMLKVGNLVRMGV